MNRNQGDKKMLKKRGASQHFRRATNFLISWRFTLQKIVKIQVIKFLGVAIYLGT